MKPFQGGIFIIAVAGDVEGIFILEKLDEIDGKETFADTTLAIENKVETLNHMVHRVCGVQLWRCAGCVCSLAQFQPERARKAQFGLAQPAGSCGSCTAQMGFGSPSTLDWLSILTNSFTIVRLVLPTPYWSAGTRQSPRMRLLFRVIRRSHPGKVEDSENAGAGTVEIARQLAG